MIKSYTATTVDLGSALAYNQRFRDIIAQHCIEETHTQINGQAARTITLDCSSGAHQFVQDRLGL